MDNSVIIEMKLGTKSFENQIKQIENRLEFLDKFLSKSKELKLNDEGIKQYTIEAEKLNNKLVDLRKRQDELNRQNMTQVVNSMSSIGNSMQGIINKTIKWGLAIFSIRSAYSAVRGVISTLSTTDDQIASDVEYIRFALANALKPVIETIIQLAYKLLTYTAYIAKAWFGVNIFANSSSKAFKQANDNMKKTGKSAKELQKTLTGIDEMNVLQSGGGTASGGGGGGVALPTFDLSDWEIEIPGWIKWIAENKDLILGFFGGLATIIATIKITQFLMAITGISSALAGMSGLAIFGMVAGIATIIIGIYNTIQGLIAFIQNPSWENFATILGGILTTITGIGIAMLTINASNPIGWIMTIVGTVGLLITSLVELVTTLNNEETQAVNTQKAEENLAKKRDELRQATDNYVNAVDKAEDAAKKLEEAEKKYKMTGEELVRHMEKEHKTYADLDANSRILYKAYIANVNAQESLQKETENLKNANNAESKALAGLNLGIGQTTGKYDEMKKSVVEAYEAGKMSAFEASVYMANAMKNMDDESRRVFAQDIPNDIKQSLSTNQYGSNFREFKNWWDRNMSSLNKDITISVKTNVTSPNGSKKYFAKGGIYYTKSLPKLASGGIINNPGAGTPIGIAGERGAEAIVPLTDSQQMALLGETIGRYITVQLTNVTELDGRTIARKVQEVNNNTNFLMNR